MSAAGQTAEASGFGVKALLQRVTCASVSVGGAVVGEIGAGLLVLLGLDKGDDRPAADRMLDRLLAYRVFADAQGRMNRSVADVNGGVLLVSQFTLSADTARGLRPGFSRALAPAEAQARKFQRELSTGLTSLVLLPFAPLGVWVGVRIAHRIQPRLFYRLVYLGMLLTGLKLVWDAFG